MNVGRIIKGYNRIFNETGSHPPKLLVANVKLGNIGGFFEFASWRTNVFAENAFSQRRCGVYSVSGIGMRRYISRASLDTAGKLGYNKTASGWGCRVSGCRKVPV